MSIVNEPLEAVAYDDLDFSVSNLRVNAVTSKPDFDETESEFLFDDSTTETVTGSKITKHIFKINTGSDTIIWYPHIHWAQESAGNVEWELKYKIWPANTLEPAWTTITGTTPEFTYTSGALHQINVFAQQDVSSLVTSTACEVKIQVSRLGGDAGDTYVGDARFMGMDFHVPIDQTMGSRQEFIK